MLESSELRALALKAGFDLCGFARAEPIEPKVLYGWLEAGFHAEMDWMKKRAAERLDVSTLLPGARTVVALACGYLRDDVDGPIARYARGRDYHATLKDRLRAFRRALRERFPTVRDYGSVDHGPVMEKVWAARAGLGYVGKNGCLITPTHGSWVLLAALILDTEVDAYAPGPDGDRCGRCNLCVTECPTGAILDDSKIDAGRCLSFQTIENVGEIAPVLSAAMNGVVFGCDICQSVCPLNSDALMGSERFAPRPVAGLSVLQLAAMSKEEYDRLVPGTPLARAGYDGLRRNAAYALGAAKDRDGLSVLTQLAADESEIVKSAARWALEQLTTARGR